MSDLNDEQLTIFRRRNIGFIFQNYNLLPMLNVYENIVLPIELDGQEVDQVFLNEIINMLGLKEKLKSILSICMTLLIGTPIAMLICRQMSISCYGKVVEYSFPFFYMGIYVLVLLLIQVILSIYQIREQKKKSIIDQLRME